MKNKTTQSLIIFIMLWVTIIIMFVAAPPETNIVTVIGHKDDHEVLLSNGTSMFVEHTYCDSFAIGSEISFIRTKKVKR